MATVYAPSVPRPQPLARLAVYRTVEISAVEPQAPLGPFNRKTRDINACVSFSGSALRMALVFAHSCHPGKPKLPLLLSPLRQEEVWSVDTAFLGHDRTHLFIGDIESRYAQRLLEYRQFLTSIGVPPPHNRTSLHRFRFRHSLLWVVWLSSGPDLAGRIAGVASSAHRQDRGCPSQPCASTLRRTYRDRGWQLPDREPAVSLPGAIRADRQPRPRRR